VVEKILLNNMATVLTNEGVRERGAGVPPTSKAFSKASNKRHSPKFGANWVRHQLHVPIINPYFNFLGGPTGINAQPKIYREAIASLQSSL
jgi:hypothetical protein